MLKLFPPLLEWRFTFEIVQPVDVDIVASGDIVIWRLFKVALSNPVGLGGGIETVEVVGKQDGVNFVEDAMRNLKPDYRIIGMSEQLKKSK